LNFHKKKSHLSDAVEIVVNRASNLSTQIKISQLKKFNFNSSKKNLILLFAQSAILATCAAQLPNYDGFGKNHPASSEIVSISISKKEGNKSKSGSGAISLPGVIGSFINIGIDVTKLILTQQEEKYTATYNSSKSETGLVYLQEESKISSADLNIDSINIIRIISMEDFSKETACDIVLIPVIDKTSGLFRLKIQRIFIPFSKAKIKKGGLNGKTIDMNITIKIDCLWKEQLTSPKSDTSDLAFQIKSATLGESIITISGVHPGANFMVEDNLYSGWFQLLPVNALKFANSENKYSVGNYSITATIKEANPYAINSKKIADYFSASSSNIETFLKQFLPPNSK
jgi:hypothetical protein